MSLIAVQSANMATANMLMIVFFVSGVLTDCPYSNTNLFIKSPQMMEGLEGSCLQIPCDFRTRGRDKFDNRRDIFGLWFKEEQETSQPKNVVFDSDGTVQEYPISITGNLSEKNCTTLFSNLMALVTGVYYFRVMNWPYRATAICDPLHITVTDSPLSPTINISGDLMEEESVNITCSALTLCPQLPPKLTWSLLNDSQSNMVENADGTFTTQIQESITLTDKHDGLNITCSAAYPVNGGTDFKTAEETRTLSVLYAPKNTSLFISQSRLVSAETTVNLTCSSRAKPPVSSFTWFKISTDGPSKVYEGDLYSFNVTEGGVYYCVATNDIGNQTSAEIKLTVTDGGLSGVPLKWEAVLGSILGVLVVLCLVVCCWCLISNRQTSQQTQIKTGEQTSVKKPAEKMKGEEEEEEEDTIHYGEIMFSELRPKPSSDSAQDTGHQQDTVYAEVKVPDTTVNQTQTTDGVEDLYMNVRETAEPVTEATVDT